MFKMRYIQVIKPQSNEDASWCGKLSNKSLHGLAWLLGQTRTRVACESMRVDGKLINQKNAQKLRPFCWACCYKVETASRSKLVNNSHATLMTGQTSKNSLTCIKIWDSSKLMRVDASWCELAVKRKRDLQLASARINSHPRLTGALVLRTLLNHYHTVHCNEPNFNVTCGVGGCPAIFTKYNSFYKHVVRKHREAYSETNPSIPCEAQRKRNRELNDHSNESEGSESESGSIDTDTVSPSSSDSEDS